jgi:hypothetical protein
VFFTWFAVLLKHVRRLGSCQFWYTWNIRVSKYSQRVIRSRQCHISRRALFPDLMLSKLHVLGRLGSHFYRCPNKSFILTHFAHTTGTSTNACLFELACKLRVHQDKIIESVTTDWGDWRELQPHKRKFREKRYIIKLESKEPSTLVVSDSEPLLTAFP